jgi:hypothetical protein
MNPPSVSRVNTVCAARTSLQAAELHISVCTVGSHLDRIRTRPAAAVAPT